jgi:hypothetical protein
MPKISYFEKIKPAGVACVTLVVVTMPVDKNNSKKQKNASKVVEY